ncbi:aspartic peptidase domain-containing protein [Xylogone sp. PMI_703]|nr:aspartic peptidase domain-containing protein [Xylogone sp. PMI_703]
MKIYTFLALARAISTAHGHLLERAPIPGVLALRYSRSSAQVEKRADKFVDLPTGASSANYIVNITAGTPPQPITLSLDTGSSDTILLTSEPSWCKEHEGYCPNVGFYNANKSSTYKYLNSDFVSNFGFADQGQGSGASGDVATDTFVIEGATLKNQQFAIAYGNPTISASILGIGYAAGENQVYAKPNVISPSYDNFPLSLAKQGATNLALFSLWKDTVDGHDGAVLFGGIDTAKYTGDLTTLATQPREGFPNITAFDVLLNGVALDGNSSFPKGSTGSVPVVLDCGTAYTILPDDWVTPIHKQFDVTYFKANDTAYVDCALQTAQYTVKYTFDSLTIEVPISRLVSLRAVNPDACSFDIVPAGDRHALLGDNFLSSAYTVFDITNNQISLAPRDFSSTDDKVVAVPAGGVKAIKGSTTGDASSSGTPTDSGAASTTSSKKNGASAVSFSGYLVGISLFCIASLELVL